VVIGGSAGIGLETARQARAEGAEVIVTGRNPERLEQAARELGALSTAAFDAHDPDRLGRFFDGLPTPIDPVLLSGSGPYYAPLREMDLAQVRLDLEQHLLLPVQVGIRSIDKVPPGGSLLFIGGTGGRRRASDSRSSGRSPRRCRRSSRTWPSSSRRSASTSSRPASSTRRCPRRCWATGSTSDASSCAPRSPSGASSDRKTSPPSPYTS
jgi:NAD(P)-dependent dehydrogenase (short-subunit alcohol dehydrogenase family)